MPDLGRLTLTSGVRRESERYQVGKIWYYPGNVSWLTEIYTRAHLLVVDSNKELLADHMKHFVSKTFLASVLALGLTQEAPGALILNAAQAITQRVTVQAIVVSDDGGANTATFFGDVSQQASILSLIDQIWAQAGIDIEFLAPHFWNSTFANIGSATTVVARPSNDLFTIRTAGDATAGVGNTDPLVIDMYFLRAAAGFMVLSANTAAGLAVLGGNGITAFVGSNLPGFLGGREVIASVIAHEIGHNLGLDHLAETENLMQASGNGERLNAAQISAALLSNLSVPLAVPEPATFLLLSLALPLLNIRRRRGRVTQIS